MECFIAQQKAHYIQSKNQVLSKSWVRKKWVKLAKNKVCKIKKKKRKKKGCGLNMMNYSVISKAIWVFHSSMRVSFVPVKDSSIHKLLMSTKIIFTYETSDYQYNYISPFPIFLNY